MQNKKRTITRTFQNVLTNLVPEKRSFAVGYFPNTNFGFPYFGSTTKNGTPVTSETTLTLSAFYNGINILGNDVAKLSKGVFEKTDGKINHLKDHPVNYIISTKPNQYQTSFTFYTVMVATAILKGNFYGGIEFNQLTGSPQKIQIWDSEKVVVKHYNKKLFYTYLGKTYGADEVIHVPGFTLDGVIGIPIVKFAAQSLGVALSAQEFSAEYYASKGVGAGYVSSEKTLDPTAKKAIGTAVSDVLTSISPWKIPVFDEGMQFKQLKITAEESQFLLTHKNGIGECARWLNLPVHKLKDLDRATNNNIEHQSIEHISDSIHPWAAKIEQEFNSKLFSEKEKSTVYTKFNLRSLLRADLKTQADYYSKAVYFGWLTIDEVRAFEEMNPVPGGDTIRTPANQLTPEQFNKEHNNE